MDETGYSRCMTPEKRYEVTATFHTTDVSRTATVSARSELHAQGRFMSQDRGPMTNGELVTYVVKEA